MAKDEEKTEEAPKGKSKMIIILVAVLAIAGGGYFFFLKPKDDATAAPVVLPAPVPGAVVQLDPITINLAGGHFLKLTMALQPTADATEVSGAKALDIAINEFSGDNIDELATKEGRTKAKEELIARVKLAYLPETETATETTASKKSSDDEDTSSSDEGSGELTGEDAITAAEELEVQPLVYDVYFTEFVMQ